MNPGLSMPGVPQVENDILSKHSAFDQVYANELQKGDVRAASHRSSDTCSYCSSLLGFAGSLSRGGLRGSLCGILRPHSPAVHIDSTASALERCARCGY